MYEAPGKKLFTRFRATWKTQLRSESWWVEFEAVGPWGVEAFRV